MQIDSGFPPLLSQSVLPKVLILGTLPGVKSLEAVKYYAHPQNSFWWIMSELFGFDVGADYENRTALLTEQGVMVWDVIASCHRLGSLDAAIDQSSLQANDFGGLLAEYPSIKALLFNGQTARKLFKRHVEVGQELDLAQYDLMVMPSTSPAYAAMKREEKLRRWRVLIDYLEV